MTIPFDLSKPETRPFKVLFFTDEDTGAWLDDLAQTNELDRSLIVHRIVKQAREAASAPVGERRATERRSA